MKDTDRLLTRMLQTARQAPRPGAGGPAVGQPRTQGPPGMVHQDQVQDPSRVPRLARG